MTAAGSLACALLLVSLALASVAAAGETVVNFDTLSSGAQVGSQYEPQGVKLGYAGEVGFGSKPANGEEGNCGKPTVESEGESGVEAASKPNYAVFANCTPSAPSTLSGTWGAMTGAAAKSLSVYVSNVSVGTPIRKVQLIAYDASGKALTSKEGEAQVGKWTHIAVTSASGQIEYFAIRTAAVGSPSELTAIDDLSYEPAEEMSGGGGGEGGKGAQTTTTTTPPAPSPPTSVVSLLTPNPHSGQLLTLSGAGSSPGSGQIISYDWDFNGDGKIDTSTGTNPIARMPFPSGPHTIGLTVTNSGGQKSSSKFTVVVSAGGSLTLPDGGEGPCETTLEVVNVDLLAECIQKAPGGYAIAGSQLSINGMTLTPRGGPHGVWHITTKRHLGVGMEYTLSGSSVTVELQNTPIGDLELGGYNLETEPIKLAFEPEHRPTFKLASSLRAHAADEERVKNLKGTPLMAFGVGHSCSPGSKNVGCCPPTALQKACATLPGGFPLTGMVAVYLTGKGQTVFDIQVGLELKSVSFQATGELELLASTETGIELSSLRFNIPEASLAPIFKVKEASFVYYFPGNPEPEKRDTWQAKATITFGLMEEPGLEGELSFQHGQFHSAALALTLPPPGVPIYPGISLNKMGGSVGVEPITFGGSLGAKIANLLELELAFKYAEATETELGFFGGKGTLKYEDNEIATLEGDVYSDGYSDALLLLKIGVPFGSKSPIVSVEGEIGYWDEAKTGLWEAYGRVHAKIWILEGEIAGTVNNRYIAGCAFVGPFGALAAWDFQTSSLGTEGFFGGGCHDDLKPYKQVPLTKHQGGFVNETETESLRSKPVAVTTYDRLAGGPSASMALAASPLGRDLRISSSAGTPIVKLVGPGGQTFTTPAAPGQVAMSGSQFIAALGGDPHQVIVYLRSPSAGAWHLHLAPGSAPISKVEVAEVAPPPAIHASVRKAHGGWALTYKVANFTPGTKMRFYERGKDSIHGIATVSTAAGSVRFTPIEALGRERKIYATVLASTGVPLQTIQVGRYRAPRAFRPARVGRLRFVRGGNTAVLSWGAVPGARVYKVRVNGGDGRLNTFFAKPGRRSETLPNVLGTVNYTATVTPVGGPDLLAGPPVSVRLAAVKARPQAHTRKRRH